MKLCDVGADGIIRGRIHAVAKSLWRGAGDEDVVDECIAAVLVKTFQHAAQRQAHVIYLNKQFPCNAARGRTNARS